MIITRSALESLEKEELPQRIKEKKHVDKQKEFELKQKEILIKLATELLDNSPIKDWFPKSQWIVEEWDKLTGSPVFRSNPDEYPIRLMIMEDGTVRTVEKAWIKQVWDGDSHPACNRDNKNYKVWWGPVAKSAADVGKMVRRHDNIMSSMPDHLP